MKLCEEAIGLWEFLKWQARGVQYHQIVGLSVPLGFPLCGPQLDDRIPKVRWIGLLRARIWVEKKGREEVEDEEEGHKEKFAKREHESEGDGWMALCWENVYLIETNWKKIAQSLAEGREL